MGTLGILALSFGGYAIIRWCLATFSVDGVEMILNTWFVELILLVVAAATLGILAICL